MTALVYLGCIVFYFQGHRSHCFIGVVISKSISDLCLVKMHQKSHPKLHGNLYIVFQDIDLIVTTLICKSEMHLFYYYGCIFCLETYVYNSSRAWNARK